MKRTKQIIDKSCTRCNARPALYSKYREHGKETGWRGVCDNCEREAKTAYRKQREAAIVHLSRTATLNRACRQCGENPTLYQKHAGGKDGYKRICMKCQAAGFRKRRSEFDEFQQSKWRKQIRDASKVFARNLKREVFARYGLFCACCGEGSHLAFLTLDHVNNDGARHRKEIGLGSGLPFYVWLRDNGWPSGYQALCWTCNSARHINGGTCPHEEERLRLVA